ncbi:hypothetical protein SLE2022_259190 [Rubroshorea leprosula]
MDLVDLMMFVDDEQVIHRKDIPRTLIRHRDIPRKDILSRGIHNKDMLRHTLLSTASLLLNSKALAPDFWKDVWLPCAVAASWMPAFDGETFMAILLQLVKDSTCKMLA